MRVTVAGSYGSRETTLCRAPGIKCRHQHVALSPVSGPRAAAPEEPSIDCTRGEFLELPTRRIIDRAATDASCSEFISYGRLLHNLFLVRTLLLHGPWPDPSADADTAWQIESLEPVRRAIRTRLADYYRIVFHLLAEFQFAPQGARRVNERFLEITDVHLLKEPGLLEQHVCTQIGGYEEDAPAACRAICAATYQWSFTERLIYYSRQTLGSPSRETIPRERAPPMRP